MSGWHKIILFGLLGLAQVTHAAMPWVSDQDAGYRSLSNLNIVTGDRAIFTNAIVHGAITSGQFVGEGSNITGVLKPSDTNGFAGLNSSNVFTVEQTVKAAVGSLTKLKLLNENLAYPTKEIISFEGIDDIGAPYVWSLGIHNSSTFAMRLTNINGVATNMDTISVDKFGNISAPYADYVSQNSILRAYAMDARYLTNAGIPAITNLFVPWLRTNEFLHADATNALALWTTTNSFVPWPATNAFLVGTATNALLLTNGNGSALSGITTGQIAGLAAFVTSNVPVQIYNTNVWAVFMIPKAADWTDITLKGHSNFFLIHANDEIPQYAITTADIAPNGTPSWENFPAGPWLPHVFFKRSHVSNARTSWIWHRLDTNSATSISAATDGSWPNPVDGWMICLRINAAWFGRYTNFQWVFNYHNDTAAEQDTHGQPLFRPIRPEWVDYDPRPQSGYNWGDGGFRGTFTYASEHQKP